MKLYSYTTADKLISDYTERNGHAHQFNEGCLGSGNWILTGLKNSFVIQEIYINSWSSGHKITRYKKLPKKYQFIFDNETIIN
jgi:hypothetical protein